MTSRGDSPPVVVRAGRRRQTGLPRGQQTRPGASTLLWHSVRIQAAVTHGCETSAATKCEPRANSRQVAPTAHCRFCIRLCHCNWCADSKFATVIGRFRDSVHRHWKTWTIREYFRNGSNPVVPAGIIIFPFSTAFAYVARRLGTRTQERLPLQSSAARLMCNHGGSFGAVRNCDVCSVKELRCALKVGVVAVVANVMRTVAVRIARVCVGVSETLKVTSAG